MAGREARRRRILEGGQDRLALITGRKPSLSDKDGDSSSLRFSPQLDFQNNNNNNNNDNNNVRSNLPSVSQTGEDKSSNFMHDQFSNISRDDPLGRRSNEEAFRRISEPATEPLLRTEPATEPARASVSEDRHKGEASSGVQKVLDAVFMVAHQIPISNVTSQQVNVAVALSEHDRLLCAVTMAILVVLSSAGFPLVGNNLFRGVLLFRPLFLVLITNITLIVWRLLPDNRKNLTRVVDKGNGASLLGDEYAWAEEAGRALELGLMVKNLMGGLLMDCGVYLTIVVFGLSLFG